MTELSPTQERRREDFPKLVFEAITKQAPFSDWVDLIKDDPIFAPMLVEDGKFGNHLFNHVFMHLVRHAKARNINAGSDDDNRIYDGLRELTRRGAPWFSSASKFVDCEVGRGALEDNPILSSHWWSARLRKDLLEAGKTFTGEPLEQLKRELVLGAERSNGASAESRLYLQDALNRIVSGVGANGSHQDTVDRNLVSAFDFCHRLHLLQATERLTNAREQIRDFLVSRQSADRRVVRDALLRIAVTDSIPLLVRAARGELSLFPTNWPRDLMRTADQPADKTLPTMFRFATLPTVVLGAEVPHTIVTNDEKALVSRECLSEVMRTLRASSLGLEAGDTCVDGYPKFGDPCQDGRMAQRRVRYLIRMACSKCPEIASCFAVFGDQHQDEQRQCADMLFRSNERSGTPQGVSTLEKNQAKLLLDIEEDSLLPSESDSVIILREVAQKVPAADHPGRRKIYKELFAGRDERAERTGSGKKRCEYITFRADPDRESSQLRDVIQKDIDNDYQGGNGLCDFIRSLYHPQFESADISDFLKSKEFDWPEETKRAQVDQLRQTARRVFQAEIVERGALLAVDGSNSEEIVKRVLKDPHERFLGQIPALHALLLDSVRSTTARTALQKLYDIFYAKPEDRELATLWNGTKVELEQALATLWNGTKDELDQFKRSRAMLYGYSCDPVLFGSRGIVGTPGGVGPVRPKWSAATPPCITPLMAAARTVQDHDESRLQCLEKCLDDNSIAKQLYGNGNENGIDAHDERGWRAIHHAFAFGNHRVAKLLLTKGANPGFLENDKTTILIEAICSRERQSRDVEGLVPRMVNLAVDSLKTLDKSSQEKVLAWAPTDIKVRVGDPLSVLSVAVEKGANASLVPLQKIASSLHGGDMVWGLEIDRFIKDRFARVSFEDFSSLIGEYEKFKEKLTKAHAEAPGETLGTYVCRALVRQIDQENLAEICKKLAKLVRIDGVRAPNDVFHTLIERLVVAGIGRKSPVTESVAWILTDLLSKQKEPHKFVEEKKNGESAIRAAWRSGQQLVALLMADKLPSSPTQLDDAAKFLVTADRQQITVAEDCRLIVGPTGSVSLKVPFRANGPAQDFPLPSDQMVPNAIKFPHGEKEAKKWLETKRTDIASGLDAALQPRREENIPEEFRFRQLMVSRPEAFEKLLAHLYDTAAAGGGG